MAHRIKVKKDKNGKRYIIAQGWNNRTLHKVESLSGRQQVRKNLTAQFHLFNDPNAKVFWDDGTVELLTDIVAGRDEKDAEH